jgi:diguanylate cyclase (GGDEF)-like protein
MENKILIVEDDAVIAQLIYQFLTRSGYQAITTPSAEEADEILKNEEINIIITDIKLPGTDGITFTKNVKKQYNLDVIITTGYSSEYFYEDAINNGASDLIFKPIRLNELMLRISRVMRERSLINERDRMIENLKKLSIRDSLTELYNSRHFYAQLDKEITRSDRYLHPLSLIFIDIDNFKAINDSYGHMVGDKALLLIAKKMKTSLRSLDTAYRFAGDEFTIILPETSSEKAKVVAERIKSEMKNESLVIFDKEIPKITLSFGIAEYIRNEEMEHFVHRADVTMYEAKKGGGNRIAIAPKVNEPSNGPEIVGEALDRDLNSIPL